MTTFIHALEILGGIGLAIFGVLYSSQRKIAIYVFFASGVIFLLVICLYWLQRTNTQPDFKAGITGTINIKTSPNYLIYLYDKQYYDNTQTGLSVASIHNAIHLELINNNNIPVKLHSYKFRALIKYDEGGQVKLVPVNSSVKPEYIPSGKQVIKWRNLYSIGPLNDQVYLATDWTKARRIDFIKSSFDLNALNNKQINPGEAINGWILFEVDEDLRYQPFDIIEYEAVLENSAGEQETIKIAAQKEDDTKNAVSGGSMVMRDLVDLTKIKWDICSIIDLKRSVKDGTPLSVIELKNIH